MQQWNKSKGSAADKSALKFPLVWFVQPFKIERGTPGFYGLLKDAQLLFVAPSQKGYKAEQRMTSHEKIA